MVTAGPTRGRTRPARSWRGSGPSTRRGTAPTITLLSRTGCDHESSEPRFSAYTQSVPGGMAERSKAPGCEPGGRVRAPWVRIPLPPRLSYLGGGALAVKALVRIRRLVVRDRRPSTRPRVARVHHHHESEERPRPRGAGGGGVRVAARTRPGPMRGIMREVNRFEIRDALLGRLAPGTAESPSCFASGGSQRESSNWLTPHSFCGSIFAT